VKKILFAALISLNATSAQALDPSRAISQYAHTAWRNRDGYFASAPSAIAQTKDGYIWVGTIAGLLRFDGVRFTPWAPPEDGPTLPSATVVSLLASEDGSLWIGTANGLARWSDGVLTAYSGGLGHINSIQEDQKGRIWIARTRVTDGKGPICEVIGSNLHCYGRTAGIQETQGQALAIDSSGRFWIGSDGALTRWVPGLGQTFYPFDARQTVRASADALAPGKDGTLWVGFFGSGRGLGLQHLERNVWKPLTIGAFDGSSLKVSSLFIDSANSLWVGTYSEGIYRIHGNAVGHFDTSDGLSGDRVQGISEDHEHNVWVATSSGIDCFRDLPVVSFSKREGLTSGDVHSVYAAEDGTVLVGDVGGLDMIRNGVVSSIRKGRSLPGAQVTSLLVDRKRRLWVGVDDGLYLYQRGRFRPILDKNGKTSNLVTQLAEDVDGSIWAAEQGPIKQLLHIRDEVISEQYPERHILGVVADPRGGVWVNLGDAIAHRQNSIQTLLEMPKGIHIDYISDIMPGRQGALWATIRQGVLRFDGDKTQLLGASNGLPCASHGSLIFDKQGSLWLTQKCGIVRIDRNSLQNWIQHPKAKVTALLLDAFDGVQIGFSDFQPSISVGGDGRLWFVNESEVQMLDPVHLHADKFPPPVDIEQLLADHRDLTITSSIRLPPLTRNIEIDYTALSFVMPQRVRFRYKLEGHDKEWQDGGFRRSAFYTDLSPGTYTFQVTARNNSNVWNRRGAALSFVILPAWYQTLCFRLLAVLSIVLLGYAFYLLRMRQYAAAMRARFNERFDERLRIARELHDTLLQSFHGLMFQFQAARNLLPRKPESAMLAMDEAILAAEQALAEGRDAIRDLRLELVAQHDLADLFRAAGQELVRARAATNHLPSFRVIVEGKPRKLSPLLEGETYRIGGEVIRNAFNHALANNIEVEIRYDEHQLRLRIRDDGRGIDPKDLNADGRPGHWGLPGIRERAQRIGARLEFWSEAGVGTEVELRVPATTAYEKEKGSLRLGMLHRGGSNGRRS